MRWIKFGAMKAWLTRTGYEKGDEFFLTGPMHRTDNDLMAQHLTDELGRQIVVQNIPSIEAFVKLFESREIKLTGSIVLI